MFLTCEGTFGIVPATMDYNGDAGPGHFHAGYQEIEGINLGYLQINGTQMFALAQVLSDLFKDIPRTTISKKMETLKIKSRRCDLQELRTLKAINSVPTRAVKCSLISKADLEALCTSCKSLSPRRRKRKRKSKRREQLLLPDPGELFSCPRPQLLPPYRAGGCCSAPTPARPKLPPGLKPRPPPAALLPQPFPRGCPGLERAPRGRRGCALPESGGLLAGALGAYPRDLALLHPAAPAPHPGLGPRCAKGLFPAEKGPSGGRKSRSSAFPGCKRQGTSAGYSSDSDSSLDFGGSSAATSSDSSEEEEEEEEEGDTSCSSEEGSSSESESSSLCSGDSVQSTRYRQAALPRFQPQPPREPLGDERPSEPPPGAGKALRAEPDLLFLSQQLWARTLRASTSESLNPAPTLGSGAQPEPYAKQEASPSSSSSSSSPPPSPSSTPGGDPPQKEGGFGGAEPCAKGKDLHKDASNNRASLGPGDRAERQSGAAAGPAASQRPPPEPPAPSPALAGGLGPDPPGEAAEPRREHFDRLIRQSKLWCYAKGFNVDGKSLRHGGRTEPCKAAELKSPGSKRAESPGTLSNKALRGNGSERNAKRRRLARGAEAERQQSSSKGRPQKTQRRNAKKGNTHCKRLGSAGPTPPRNSFSLMGNFPCIPSLVVGEDGDLCPASSLGGKNSWALSKTHPLWRWHLGGNAIPVPPSLKFRGYSLEDL